MNDARGETGEKQTLSKLTSGALTGLVSIVIESDVDSAMGRIAKLVPLQGCRMSADGTGGVAKARLPQDSEVKQSFDENHIRGVTKRFPGEQAAFRTWQQAMREGPTDAAAIKIHNAAVITAGEDHAPGESVIALRADQARFQKQIQGIAEVAEMWAQFSVHGIADAQFFNDAGIV